MAKFDMKEHDKRMREILNRQRTRLTPEGSPLSPLPPGALERLKGVARQQRRGIK